jgi:hypothetical protein
VEDRISGLKDKIDIKKKTEEDLDKSRKSCKKNMQNSATPSKDQT